MGRHSGADRRNIEAATRWATCPTDGLRAYFDRKDAKVVAKLTDPGDHMVVYRCGDNWHVGRLPEGVRHGETARDDLAPPGSRTDQ